MLIYSVYENGSLNKVNKIQTIQNRVYIIDDYKTIYLWFGLKASKKKKDKSVTRAKALNKERDPPANILKIKQNEEYGAFLAMMDILKMGLKENLPLERRAELNIEIEDTMELIDIGLEIDLEAEITIAAHEISRKNKTYEELCHELAETTLAILKSKGKPSAKEIKENVKKIHESSSTYEEICWLIAELNTLKKKNHLIKLK